MEEFTEPLRIKKEISNLFDVFKVQHDIDLDITMSVYDNNIEFNIENCISGYYDIGNRNIHILDVESCGTSISLLLQFIKEIIDLYGLTYSVTDASNFHFQNETTNEIIDIELKKLYILCYGQTFYSRYLSSLPPLKHPYISIEIFDGIVFTDCTNCIETIQTIKNNTNIKTIGDFFTFIKDDLKKITVNPTEGVKVIKNENWEKIITYKFIIYKTYDFLEKNKNIIMTTSPQSNKRKSSPQSNKRKSSPQSNKRKSSQQSYKRKSSQQSYKRKNKRTKTVLLERKSRKKIS
jgi:hypothetical protein